MANERELQLECAKLQAAISKAEEGITAMRKERDQIMPLAEANIAKVKKAAKEEFLARQSQDKTIVTQTCRATYDRISDFLDTCPDIDAKDYAGRYEIKDLEAKLCELYPEELIEHYVCVGPMEFEDERDAYQVYTSAEQRVARLKNRSIAAALFSGMTSLMESAAEIGGLGAKVALIAVGLLFLLTFIQPFLLLGVLCAVGVISAAQGLYVGVILRQLFSVKEFLNDEYDEDIFQQDKADIMEDVQEFLDGVESDYIEEIDAREFIEPETEVEQIRAKAQQDVQNMDLQIASKVKTLDDMKVQAASKLEAYEKAVADRKQAAAKAREKYLGTFDWKSEWFSTLFLDVNSEDKIIGCPWSQKNTLFMSKSINSLQQFSQLAIFQNVLHVHPSFAGQAVIDYKYMGGNLLPFSKLPSCVIDICVEPEKIDKKMGSINMDVRARCNNILQSCASIEDFNKLMETYGVTGESYVTLHFFGLASFNNELRMILKNGPKVGYFTKLYMTLDELQEVSKDFPFDDVPEFVEVSDKVVFRTAAQVQRLLNVSA